jgi:hypothetical protein
MKRGLCWLAALTALLTGCVGYGFPGDYGGGYGGSDGYYGGGYPDYGSGGYPGGGDVFRCESNDNRTRECSTGGRGGARLVRTLSDAPCVQGRSWGTTRSGVWVSNGCRGEFVITGYGSGGGWPEHGSGSGRTFRCESRDERTQRCSASTRGGVSLVRQLSDSPCIEGRSWGYDGNGVWVSNGCRGEFRSGTGSGGGWSGGGGQTVRCESKDDRGRRCDVPVRRGVQLIRQLSDTRCVQGENWGWDAGGIWVSRGCRAEFQVR